MRKRKYTKNGKRSKTYRKKHTGGAGLIRNLGITALADRARGISTEQRKEMNEEKAKGPNFYERAKTKMGDKFKGIQEGFGQMKSAFTGGPSSNVPDESDGTKNGTEDAEDAEDATNNGSNGEGENDPIYTEYNKELINRLSKKIDETEEELLERMLNAAYIHITNNGDVILKSINNALYNIIKIDPIIKESTKIIIVQAMYAASTHVHRAIENAFDEYRDKETASGTPTNQIIFNPTTPAFINSFMQQFTIIVKGVINT